MNSLRSCWRPASFISVTSKFWSSTPRFSWLLEEKIGRLDEKQVKKQEMKKCPFVFSCQSYFFAKSAECFFHSEAFGWSKIYLRLLAKSLFCQTIKREKCICHEEICGCMSFLNHLTIFLAICSKLLINWLL